jgi:hypothetical protein
MLSYALHWSHKCRMLRISSFGIKVNWINEFDNVGLKGDDYPALTN